MECQGHICAAVKTSWKSKHKAVIYFEFHVHYTPKTNQKYDSQIWEAFWVLEISFKFLPSFKNLEQWLRKEQDKSGVMTQKKWDGMI